jgi:hypothetical protein
MTATGWHVGASLARPPDTAAHAGWAAAFPLHHDGLDIKASVHAGCRVGVCNWCALICAGVVTGWVSPADAGCSGLLMTGAYRFKESALFSDPMPPPRIAVIFQLP